MNERRANTRRISDDCLYCVSHKDRLDKLEVATENILDKIDKWNLLVVTTLVSSLGAMIILLTSWFMNNYSLPKTAHAGIHIEMKDDKPNR